MEPFGSDQEALVGLRTRSGEAWGVLALYRAIGRPQFDADELELLRELSTLLPEGVRRGLLIGKASDPERIDTPGVVVLREDWGVESLTPGVEYRLAALPDGDWETRGTLPASVPAWQAARCGVLSARTHRAS